MSYEDHHFKSKRNPMLLANIECDGSESNFTTCCSTVISDKFDCHSGIYAGVRCMLISSIILYMGIITCMHYIGSQCIENSIQLVGELSQHEGSPVICLGGSWGKICGISNFTAAAVVICRQLGFSTEG